MAKQTAAQLEDQYHAADAQLRSWPDDATRNTPEYVALCKRAARLHTQWIRTERHEQRFGEMS